MRVESMQYSRRINLQRANLINSIEINYPRPHEPVHAGPADPR